MTLIATVRAQRFRAPIQALARHYDNTPAHQARLAIQLDLWNAQWVRIVATVPYYTRLVHEGRLPQRFESWHEFVERMPVTTRPVVQQHRTDLFSTERPPDLMRMTGGSTNQPIQIPLWNSEQQYTVYDRWLARSWYGITPGSRLFMLWGHSHLLGTGFKGWVNARKRMLFDRLLGCLRYSAYNLAPDALRRAADALVRFRPDYVVGYSVALDQFARVNQNRRSALSVLGLKAVIATAEGFPSPESQGLLRDLFGCPIALEYGAVETAMLAHTRPGHVYQTFWRTYFVEAERQSDGSAGHTVRVTALYPRCFPLVRYELGDEIDLGEVVPMFVLGVDRFERVIGRCEDYVRLPDGFVVHSAAFTHVARSLPQITGYQVVQSNDSVRLTYTATGPVTDEQVAGIRERLTKIHPWLGNAQIVPVERLRQTVAGKTRLVIKDQTSTGTL